MHTARAEHLIHPREGLGCLGKHHQPADRTVKTVHDAAKHIAGLGIFLLNPTLKCLDKRLIARLIALHNLAGQFIHYNYMIVFVDYFHNESEMILYNITSC